MSIIIRLQNLPWSADSAVLRHFFDRIEIPDGGIHIMGGEKGIAFIALRNEYDFSQAMLYDGGVLHGNRIKLVPSNYFELDEYIERLHIEAINRSMMNSDIYDNHSYEKVNRRSPKRGFAYSPERNVQKKSQNREIYRKSPSRNIRRKSPFREFHGVSSKEDILKSSEYFVRKKTPERIIVQKSERLSDTYLKRTRHSRSPVPHTSKSLSTDYPFPLYDSSHIASPHQKIDVFHETSSHKLFEEHSQKHNIEPEVKFIESSEHFKIAPPEQTVFFNQSQANIFSSEHDFSKHVDGTHKVESSFSDFTIENTPKINEPNVSIPFIGDVEFSSSQRRDYKQPQLSIDNLRYPDGFAENKCFQENYLFDPCNPKSPYQDRNNFINTEFMCSDDKNDLLNRNFSNAQYKPHAFYNPPPNYCIKLSRFSPHDNFKDVQQVLKRTYAPQKNIKWDMDDYGNKTGIAYVKICNKEDFCDILECSVLHLNKKSIEVYRCPDEIFEKMFPDTFYSEYENNLNDLICMLRGLPYTATENEILHFFKDLKLIDLLILYDEDGKATGTAYVEFDNLVDYEKAFERNGKKIGYRYIELLKRSHKDVVLAKKTAISMSNPFKVNNQRNVFFESSTLRLSTDVRPLCALLSGIPPNIQNSQIFNFFSEGDVLPHAIHIIVNDMHCSVGRAYVEFFNPFEFDTAVKQNGKSIEEYTISVKQVLLEEMVSFLDAHQASHFYTNKILSKHSSSPVPEKVPYLWDPPDEKEESMHKLTRSANNRFASRLETNISKNIPYGKYDDHSMKYTVGYEKRNVQVFDYSHRKQNEPFADMNPNFSVKRHFNEDFKHKTNVKQIGNNEKYSNYIERQSNVSNKHPTYIEHQVDHKNRYPFNVERQINNKKRYPFNVERQVDDKRERPYNIEQQSGDNRKHSNNRERQTDDNKKNLNYGERQDNANKKYPNYAIHKTDDKYRYVSPSTNREGNKNTNETHSSKMTNEAHSNKKINEVHSSKNTNEAHSSKNTNEARSSKNINKSLSDTQHQKSSSVLSNKMGLHCAESERKISVKFETKSNRPVVEKKEDSDAHSKKTEDQFKEKLGKLSPNKKDKDKENQSSHNKNSLPEKSCSDKQDNPSSDKKLFTDSKHVEKDLKSKVSLNLEKDGEKKTHNVDETKPISHSLKADSSHAGDKMKGLDKSRIKKRNHSREQSGNEVNKYHSFDRNAKKPRMRGRNEICDTIQFPRSECIVQASRVHPKAGLNELLDFFGNFFLTSDDIIRRYTESGIPTDDIRIAFRNSQEATRAIQELNYRNLRGIPIKMYKV